MNYFHPHKSTFASKQLEEDSINLVNNIFRFSNAITSDLKKGDKNADTVGDIVICNENDEMICKVTVQIKHLTYPTEKGKTFFDINGFLRQLHPST